MGEDVCKGTNENTLTSDGKQKVTGLQLLKSSSITLKYSNNNNDKCGHGECRGNCMTNKHDFVVVTTERIKTDVTL